MLFLIMVVIAYIGVVLCKKLPLFDGVVSILCACWIMVTIVFTVMAHVPVEYVSGVVTRDIVQFYEGESWKVRGGGNFLSMHMSGGGVPQYVIMEKLGDGEYLRVYLDQRNTSILVREGAPCVAYPKFSYYGHPWLSAPWMRWLFPGERFRRECAKITVPPGTVVPGIAKLRIKEVSEL